MAAPNARSLISKLNPLCFKALIEGASGLCMARTNYYIELEHLLLKLLEQTDSDLPRLLRHYDVNLSAVNRQLTAALDKLKRGNDRTPGLSTDILDAVREAWMLASVEYRANKVRSGYLLVALLTDRNLSSKIEAASSELAKINGDQLFKEVAALVKGGAEDQYESVEYAGGEAAAAGPGAAPGQAAAPGSKTPVARSVHA